MPNFPKWTGFQDKTMWDWFQLVGAVAIPIVLGFVALTFNRAALSSEELRAQTAQELESVRAQSEQDIESERAREAALQAYLDRMTEMLLDDSLRVGPRLTEDMQNVARARTISILRNLDAERNRSVLRFLHDAMLIAKRGEDSTDFLISLIDADLSNTDLSGVILMNANLHGANLINSNLQRSETQDTNLQRADLSNAVLTNANLSQALLKGADLCSAWLVNTDLSGADLEGAILLNANLRNANLENAKVADEQLAQAANLTGAKMPDGSVMTKERWEQLKQQLSSTSVSPTGGLCRI